MDRHSAKYVMPESVRGGISTILDIVHTRSTHDFLPSERAAFLSNVLDANSLSSNVRGWLAILAAKKVLPVFNASLPNVRTPTNLLTLAERIIKKTLDKNSWRVKIYSEYAYTAIGHSWGLPEDDVPLRVHFAGYATDKALDEARGFHFLSKESIEVLNTNQQIVHTAFGDTAAAALCAVALDEQNALLSPSIVLQFWKWWLLEAVPQAWKLAHIH